MDDDELAQATREELVAVARTRGVTVRTRATKKQLAEALAGNGDGRRTIASRVEAFTRLAEERARGEMVLIPRMLTGNDRRRHVRETIREDHSTRIQQGSDGAQAKFDKLAGSLFSFFRGTCLLFYRDMPGEDAAMPTVLTAGDVHPENFGVLPSEDDVPIFGINDVDEAYYAPFTWDLKRGAVSFMIAAAEKGGYGRSKQRSIAARFVRGYVAGMRRFAEQGNEDTEQLRLDTAPPLIAKLISGALSEGRAGYLQRKYLDEAGRGFRATDELVPLSSRRDEFQAVIDRFAEENDLDVPARTPGLRVKDVARRTGQGTASLGLDRYYLLLAGPAEDGTADVLVELKQARRSALAGLVPPSDFLVTGAGDRISHAQHVQVVGGDVFFGSVNVDGRSFLARERSPYRDDVSLGKLSKSQWKDYAEICGGVLAHAHALSDEAGEIDHDIEPTVLAAIGVEELFVDDILRFAEESAARVRADHAHFRADHALDAFRTVDAVYR